MHSQNSTTWFYEFNKILISSLLKKKVEKNHFPRSWNHTYYNCGIKAQDVSSVWAVLS